jgi:hypothetical protein
MEVMCDLRSGCRVKSRHDLCMKQLMAVHQPVQGKSQGTCQRGAPWTGNFNRPGPEPRRQKLVLVLLTWHGLSS